jgi:protocatechuate 3,4-dioxygenase beta subunit
MTHRDLSRRHLLLASAGLLIGCQRSSGGDPPVTRTAYAARPAPPTQTPPSHHATQVCAVTAPNIEGPFYKAGAPERASLGKKRPGVPLVVEGIVRDGGCRPIPGAWLDVWHADHEGAYDNVGFGLRGRLRADRAGRYRLETLVPGHYLNGPTYRPAHIHVKLFAPGFQPLTTQLYFPDDPYNEGDPFIVDSLVMTLSEGGQRRQAHFDFSLAPARPLTP